MNHHAIIRRHLAILRMVQPPFLFPTKKQLLERLQAEDLDKVSPRTIERDIKEIQENYGIRIKSCPRRKGYYLEKPQDEDLSNFGQFLQLLERSERLAFLTHSTDALRTSQYLLLEENQRTHELEHLPVLWEALRSQRQLSFHYQTFGSPQSKLYQLDPLLLLEYRNRWYLATWDQADVRFKTFGLERMREPQLTETTVQIDRRPEFLALKQDGLGVFIGPEQQVTEVVLRVDSTMRPYLKTVPLHLSQTTLEESREGMVVSLRIVLNNELEMAILAYGEHIEVLEPQELREKMKLRVREMARRYEA
ncbi:YafY family protein [Rufibacter sp. XAAS-G3-1]|uniref:helix-turn-helix transcriptional regulator n=1 Tax=Rufibacter sp. XAAS-G3-1 TaxID=2729134 RepID=UPI0015E64164|nr:WYL domain-containing protein [Rufibacter sp. XAAS-G3-1]